MRESTMMSNAIKQVNGNLGLLRPYLKNDKTYVQYGNAVDGYVEVEASKTGLPFLRNVTGLPIDSWKAIDDAVLKEADDKYLSAWDDVTSRGLVKQTTEFDKLFYSRKMSDFGKAVKDMDGVSNRQVDTPTHDVDTLPLFVSHADFEISWRDKGAFGAGAYGQGNLGIDWDTSMFSEGIKNIKRLNEQTLFQGYDVPYGSSYVRGYTNFGERNQVELDYDWSLSATTSAQIYADTKKLLKAATTTNFQDYNKVIMYIRPEISDRFSDDYNSSYAGTLRDRLLKLEGLEAIKVSSYLPSAQDVVMVRMDASSVRIIQGTSGILPVMWYDNAGMQDKLTLMSIQEPQLRATVKGYTSVTHGLFE